MPSNQGMQTIQRYRLSSSCPICNNVSKTCCTAPVLEGRNDPFVLCAEVSARSGVDGWSASAPKTNTMGGRWWLFRPLTAQAKAAYQKALDDSSVVSKEYVNKAGKKRRSKTAGVPSNVMGVSKRNKLSNMLREHCAPKPGTEGFKDLVRRGMSADQISRYHFLELSMTAPYPEADFVKPGVYKWLGSSFWHGLKHGMPHKSDYRYMVPAYDYDGKVSGAQVHIHKEFRASIQGGESIPKYVWTPRTKDEEWEGLRWSKDNDYGETPLQCLKGEDPGCNYILLVEGLLKPLVLYERLGRQVTVLGASGGLFKSSPDTLDDIVRRTMAERDCTHAAIVLDPGSLDNPGMVIHYNDALRILQSYGLITSYIDYGQGHDSSAPGPDEVDPKEILSRAPVESTGRNIKTRLMDFVVNHTNDEAPKSVNYNIPQPTKVPYLKGAAPVLGTDSANLVETNELILDIYSKDVKYILNRASLGSGKSTTVPDIPLLDEEEGKIWYVTLTPRNPPTPRVEEEFTLWPSRHDGLYIRGGTKTPNGHDVLMRGESSDTVGKTQSNCIRAKEHNTAVQHGLPGGAICATCPIKLECMTGIDDQYTYLYDKKKASNAKRIRTSLQGINPDTIKETDIVVIDEPPQSAPFMKRFEVNKATFARIILMCSDVGINLAFSQGEDTPDQDLDIDLSDWHIEELTIDWDKTNASLEQVKKRLQQIDEILARNLSKGLSKGPYAPKPQAHELLKACMDPSVTVYREKGGKRQIYAETRNVRLDAIIRNAGKVIFLDATAEPLLFAAQYDIDPDQLAVVMNEDKATDNVVINVVPVTGFNSKPKTEEQKTHRANMVDLMRASMTKRLGREVGFIDHGAFIQEGDLRLFSDSRGSNRFKDKKAVVMFGLPNPHLINAQQSWALIQERLPDNLTFNDYYGFLTNSEIKQAVGRLRGFRRDEPLVFYVAANVKLPKLEEEGYRVISTNPTLFGAGGEKTPQRKFMDLMYLSDTRLTPWDNAQESILEECQKYNVPVTEEDVRRTVQVAFSALLDSDRSNYFDGSVPSQSVDTSIVEAAMRLSSMPPTSSLSDYVNIVQGLSPMSLYQALFVYYDRAKPRVDQKTRNWLEILVMCIFEGRLKGWQKAAV